VPLRASSLLLAWRESVLEMEVFDEIRRQNDFRYPENIERV
jgi:hypothetical protein